jgi:SAM-dependent methyltransferase
VAPVVVAGIGLVLAGVQTEWDHGPRVAAGELFRRNSSFGLLQVIDRAGGTRRYYLNDYIIQNTYDPQTRRSTSLFSYLLHGLAQAYTTNIAEVLCIGLGVGIVPAEFAREGARVDVVEINPAVVPVAERYFDLDAHRLNLWIGDGRYFLNRCRRQYDAVVLDAFLGESAPSHLMTREAFREIRRVLRPGGVLVINSIGDRAPGKDFLVGSLDKTLKAVFGSVRIHAHEAGNVFFVASDKPGLGIIRRPDLRQVHPLVFTEVHVLFASTASVSPASGRILTDDFNPVEVFDARNREAFRRRLAMSMKGP